MTKTKEKRPGTPASVQSADLKDQLHSTTPTEEIQALCNTICADLCDKVATQLSEAKVLLNDQGNLFFDQRNPETEQEKTLLLYSFPYASIRQDVIRDLILDAARGLADVLDRLEPGIREGRLPE